MSFPLYNFKNFTNSAVAAFSRTINYQGKLTDTTNLAVADGAYNLRFKLYTTATGGSPIWTETSTSSNAVSVTSGLFSTMLGSISTLDSVNFNQPLYLSVEVGGTTTDPVWDGEMSPRKQLGAVPNALNALTLDGLATTSLLRSDAVNATGTITNFNFFSASGTNATSTNFFASIISAVTAAITNFTATNATTTNLTATNLTVAGTSTFRNVLPDLTGGVGVLSQYSLGNSSNVWNGVTAGQYYVGTSSWAMKQSGENVVINHGSLIESGITIKNESGYVWFPRESNRNWTSIAMSADGSRQTAVVGGGQIYISSDHGNSWTAKASSLGWTSVAISSDGSKQTAVNNGGQIYISSDFGQTWTLKYTGGEWTSVAMSADGLKQIAASGNTVYTSTNGGETWSLNKTIDTCWSTPSVTSVALSVDGSTRALGVSCFNENGDSEGSIYVSRNSGNSWTDYSTGLNNISSIAVSANGSTMTAVSSIGTVLVYSAGTDLWVERGTNDYWRGVALSADGSNQIAVGTNEISTSADYGQTWISRSLTGEYSAVAMSANGSYQSFTDAGGQIYVSGDLVRMGINTTSPVAELEVVGTASSSALTVSGNATIFGTASSSALVVSGNASISTLTLPNNTQLIGDTSYLRSTRGLAFGSDQSYYVNQSGFGNISGLSVSTSTTSGLIQYATSSPTTINRRVTKVGDYVYMIDQYNHSLSILDVSSTTSPILKSTTVLSPTTIYDVYVQNDKAYITGFSDSKLWVYDVTNKTAPSSLGSVSLGIQPQSVKVSSDDHTAFVTGNGLKIINVTNPAAMTVLSTVSSSLTDTYCRGLDLSGDYLYLACEGGQYRDSGFTGDANANIDGKLSIIDISSSTNPVVTASTTGDADFGDLRDVKVSGNYVYADSVTGRFVVFQVAVDKTSVSKISSLLMGTTEGTGSTQVNTPSWLSISNNLYGNYAYVANPLLQQVQIVDISNPSSPRIFKNIDMPTGLYPSEAYWSDNYLYVPGGAMTQAGPVSGGFVIISESSLYNFGLLSVLGKSTLRDIIADATNLYSIGSSASRYLAGWFNNINIGTSTAVTWSLSTGGDGRLGIFAGASGTGNERLTITSSGNVGIGTTSPIAKLHVDGGIYAEGDITSALAVCWGGGSQCNAVDIAELYPTTDHLVGGDLVMIDEASSTAIKKATASDPTRLLGVISTHPAILIEGEKTILGAPDPNRLNGRAALALVGRVPVTVSTEAGPIHAGDRITISSLPGIGMKATGSAYTIGLALENWDGSDSTTTAVVGGASSTQDVRVGQVTVFVNLSYAKLSTQLKNGTIVSADPWMIDLETGKIKPYTTLDLAGVSIENIKSLTSASGKWSVDEEGRIVAESLELKKGLILFDEQTGDPYCLTISGGITKTTPGKCDGTVVTTAAVGMIISTTTPPVSDATSSTTVPVIESSTTASTTTSADDSNASSTSETIEPVIPVPEIPTPDPIVPPVTETPSSNDTGSTTN